MAPEQWLLTSILGHGWVIYLMANGGAGAVDFMVTLMYDPGSDWCTKEWGAQPPLIETGRAWEKLCGRKWSAVWV